MSLGKRKHNGRPDSPKGNPVQREQRIVVQQTLTNDDIAALALQGWYYDRHGNFVPPASTATGGPLHGSVQQPEIRRVWSIYPWRRG